MRITGCLIALLVTACAASTSPAAAPSPSGAGSGAIALPPSASPSPATSSASASPIATAGPFSATLSGPIQRLDPKVGFATTESGLIVTEDGGATWAARGRNESAVVIELR